MDVYSIFESEITDMVTLDKLIVVGMSKMPNCPTVKVGDALYVSLESNDKGVSGKALKVYKQYGTDQVGYVRNTDLEAMNCNGTIAYHQALADLTSSLFTVDVVRANYLAIKKRPTTNAVKVAAETKSAGGYKQEYDAQYIQEPIKKDTNMLNTNSMRDQFFREVKNVAIDIQTGKFGISNQDGISVYVDGTINVTPIQELGVKIPAFAMRIPVDKLVAGDIIVNGNESSFFVSSIKEGGYKVMSTSGEVSTVGNVKNLFFGANTVLAVKNMFEGSGMNPMMMALMMGDGKMDMKSLMLMSMMGGQGGDVMGGMNPMMLMLMMGDKFK